jgi:16S rRNA (guanine527-N7)-methyltransferase
VEFEEELSRVLPSDLPHRDRLIQKAAHHLELIHAVNDRMNLTRITSAREAAIKHVYDSVAPWHHFWGVKRILDAGTGAGFPGIPLAIVLPDTRFTLAEATHKKARFVDAAVESLELSNVHVVAQRAEERAAQRKPEVIVARAVAPMSRILEIFRIPLKQGARLLLYKGRNVEAELAEALKHRISAQVLCRYELPDGCGSRALIEITLNSGQHATRHRQPPARRAAQPRD